MRSLSILFTNNTLAARAGSELWVRDVCRALIGRGHRPVAFSLVLGAVADEMRLATVPVVDDLANVAVAPDLIHGHHHIETLIAALHFPGVPIVHFCHGFLPWEEAPLRHPSIVRYVAVDDPTADRLTTEAGIGPDQLDRLLNFVDLGRFHSRAPLPRRPQRALVLSNIADDGGYVALIREACRRSGIELEVAGLRSGRVVECVEDILVGTDLVFAKGRSALEAMAVGCAVVLADANGCGPIVSGATFETMRSQNFGIRLLREPHSVAWYESQIAAYDPADAASIAARVRREAGLEQAVDRLLEIYERALARGVNLPASHRDVDAQRAAARHLSWVAGRFKHTHEIDRDRQLLSLELATARNVNERLDGELNEAASANDRLASERDSLRHQVAAYESLLTVRLRDALIRVPLVGPSVRQTASWLKRLLFRTRAVHPFREHYRAEANAVSGGAACDETVSLRERL